MGEGEVGRGSCELGILWSDLVRELRNNKYTGKPDLLSVKEVKSRYLGREFVCQCSASGKNGEKQEDEADTEKRYARERSEPTERGREWK